MRIMVLGCGPAGLMAAQGAHDAFSQFVGVGQVAIMSQKQKSPIFGCQYLHEPIPRITPDNPRVVSYTLRGDPDDYRRKVYGPMWGGSVSPEDLPDDHKAWDLRETYDRLWFAWEDAINDVNVDPAFLNKTLQGRAPDLIINSIPRPALCFEGHSFGMTEVWAAGDAPALGIKLPFQCPDDMVICNAEENPAWYRMSRVFGHTTVEWPGALGSVPVTTAARVTKPTKHSCDCWSEATLIHVGRYGRWEKGVLSHTAYWDAFNKVTEMIGGSSAADEEEASMPQV